MDQKSDLIREDIDETRHQLTEKLEVLEGQLRETVESAKSTVEDTIENVRENLRKFTPTYQIQEHPLLYLGGVVAAGVVVGRSLASRTWETERSTRLGRGYPGAYSSSESGLKSANLTDSDMPPTSEYEEVAGAGSPFHLSGVGRSHLGAGVSTGPSALEKLTDTFSDEIEMIKGMAMSALLGTVRDFAKRTVPNLGTQIDQVMDSAMQKFGVSPSEAGAPDIQSSSKKGNESNNEWRDQSSPKQEENLASKVV